MDAAFDSLTYVLLVVFTCILTFFAYQLHRSSNNNNDNTKLLPPGSLGWPIIGETLSFLLVRPEKFVNDRMNKYSPLIFKTKIMGEKTAVICGPDGHKFLFSNEEKLFTAFRTHSMQRIFGCYNQTCSTSESTRVIRQPGFFKPEALARYLGKMDTITQQLLQFHWDCKSEIKAYPFAKTLTLTLACTFFLGLNIPERIAKLVTYFDEISLGLHAMVLDVPGTAFYRANKAAAAVRRELIGVIKEKREAVLGNNGLKMQDILGHMMFMKDSKGESMPENEIADKMMGLLVAGYSTVATTITFLMKYVGERADIYENIFTEQRKIGGAKKGGEVLEWEDMQKMKYSWSVVCETMRLTPPLQGNFRKVVADFSYAGYTVPKGWKVYWSMSSTNKNAAYFEEPGEFDPSRYYGAISPYTYVPFGGGPRMCPGKEYARLAILTFLHNAVIKYKWELVAPDEKVIGHMMPTPQKGLPIRLHHH